MGDARKVKVHRLEVLVIDFDEIGSVDVAEVLEATRYPNRCISPRVLGVATREVLWTDEHPLNRAETFQSAVRCLFEGETDV